MLKKEYYCLVAGLPDLFFYENKPGINSFVFKRELKNQLTIADYRLVEIVFFPFDNYNLLNLYFHQNKSFNELGNIDKSELEMQLLPSAENRILPEYMLQFIKRMKQREMHKLTREAENFLHTLYYEFAMKYHNRFLRDWLDFELNLKNTVTAFNCVQHDYDLSEELIKTNRGSEVYSLLLNKRLPNPDLYEDILPFADQIFKVTGSSMDMLEKEKALDKIKWDYLDEQTFFHYFTIEKVLSYVIKLLICERWMRMDKETGQILLDKLVNELKTSHEFLVEFSL